MTGKPLPAEKVSIAVHRIAAWRAAPLEPIACPVCDVPDLKIVDQSARPYAEWYGLTCAACGLNATLQLPMAPPNPGSDPA